MSDDYPDVPPWEPIADWLSRAENVDCDPEYEETREPTNATRKDVRERYERTAKVIAYQIATYDGDDLSREVDFGEGTRSIDGVPIVMGHAQDEAVQEAIRGLPDELGGWTGPSHLNCRFPWGRESYE